MGDNSSGRGEGGLYDYGGGRDLRITEKVEAETQQRLRNKYTNVGEEFSTMEDNLMRTAKEMGEDDTKAVEIRDNVCVRQGKWWIWWRKSAVSDIQDNMNIGNRYTGICIWWQRCGTTETAVLVQSRWRR